MKCIHFLIFILLISDFTAKAQETIVLQPGPDEMDDAAISVLTPNNNYGGYDYILADAWTHTGYNMYLRSFFEFDLSQIPVNSTITEAKLTLFGTVKSGNETHGELSGSNEAIIARVIDPWNEYNVTWNDQPGITTTNEYTTNTSNVPYEDFVDMDVTDLLQDMVNNPGESYGFRLKLKTEFEYRRLVFASSDNDTLANRPKLEITYEPASPQFFFPLAPSQISASYEDNGDVTITWKDNSDNESNFVIERALVSDEVFQELSSTTDTFYVDATAEHGVSYQYRVKAVTSDSFYKYSGAVEITPNSITIDDENDTICDVYFMDPAFSNIYNPSMDFTQTVYPAMVDKYVKIDFSYVNLSSGDYLEVYNGTSTTDELLKKFTDQNNTIILNSSDESGALTFKFKSTFGSKNAQGWYGLFSCIDIEPAPTDLSVTQSNDTIWLSWTDNVTGEDGYIIYRSEDGTSFSPVDTVNANVVTYFEVDHSTGTHLYYKTRTTKGGVISAFSNTADITVPGPLAPSDITISSRVIDSLKIYWIDISDNEDGFILERSVNSSPFEMLAVLPVDSTYFYDSYPDKDSSLVYRVNSYNGDDTSDWVTSSPLISGTIFMYHDSIKGCDYHFTDPGGTGNYENNSDITTTLWTVDTLHDLKISFDQFILESGYDYLKIYDGSSTSAPLIGSYSGTDIEDESITSNNDEGCLTFRFTSDNSISRPGWKGHIQCIPKAPGDLSITPGKDSISLSWTDLSAGEIGYIVMRSEDSLNFVNLDTLVANAESFTDTGLLTGKKYYYQLGMLYDNSINYSNIAWGSTLGPHAPTGITISEIILDSLLLTWNDNAQNENGFIIQRKLNSGEFQHLITLPTDSTSYYDYLEGLDSLLTYRIASYNDEDTSYWVVSQEYETGVLIMQQDSVVGCGYMFLDPGGRDNYPNNADITTTLCAIDTVYDLIVRFEQFLLESSYDKLKIYDGGSTSAPLIGNFSDDELEGESIISNNREGCLTFEFTSDYSINKSGWAGLVQCLPIGPDDLAVTPAKDSLSLSWTDISSEESGYIIMRSDDSISFTNLDTIPANTVSYTDRGLLTGKKYYYQLGLIADYGISYSNIAHGTTLGPLAPTDIHLNVINLDSIYLSWIDNANNENGFIIERKLNIGDFELLINLPADSTSYYDNIAGLDSMITYRIASYNDEDTSYWVVSQEYEIGVINMEPDTITACGYVLLDPGGKDNYSNNLDIITFLYPGEPGEQVYLQFEEYDLENHCDFLEIYNGDTIAENLIGKYTSPELLNETVYANNNEGFLSLRFTSDYIDTREGFRANVGCYIMPDKPENLSVSAGTKSLSLAWTDISTQEWGYIIYRSSDSIDFMAIDTVAADINTYIDEPLETGHKYFYKVAAYHDIAKNFSGIKSNVVSGPLAPTGLTAYGSDQGVQLNWNDNSLNETGFVILRSTDGENYTTLDSVGINVEEYVDTNVTIGNSYYYMVYAYVSLFSSDYSNSASITITTIEEIPGFTSLKIFPNPGNGIYSMNYFAGMEKSTFKVFDVLGKTVGCNIEFLNKGAMQIDISHLQDGIYLLKIYTGNKQKSLKLIKE